MRYRVTIRNHNYGLDLSLGIRGRICDDPKPWNAWQARGGNRSFATFAEAVEFVDNGSWS